MSWVRQLCTAYDVMADSGSGDGLPLPAGFVRKNVKYNVILSAAGEFVTAQVLPKEESACIVPSTPGAESRTSKKRIPFPLAEQLQYFGCTAEGKGVCLQNYLEQLSKWCESPGAPDCLRVLRDYLEKETLYEDLQRAFGPKFKYNRDGTGGESKNLVCFSVETLEGDHRLWMRQDVRESWSRFFAASAQTKPELCYALGQWLPALEIHPKVGGNAKLISGHDEGFPFRYRGRFTEKYSAASISALASQKAHSTLDFLLKKQGFTRYGVSFVGWNMAQPQQEESLLFGGLSEEERRPPDTFEPYAKALASAAQGFGDQLTRSREEEERGELTDGELRRRNEIIILGLQATSNGRMAVIYDQEIPGGEYVRRLERWYEALRWELPGKVKTIGSPTWGDICEAVMGQEFVRAAKEDVECKKSASKWMRQTMIRLLDCTAGGKPLPFDLVRQAFSRAVRPLTFQDGKGEWQPFAWGKCVAATCAMIRAYLMGLGKGEVRWELDEQRRSRDYLFGRLLAVCQKLEQDTVQGEDAKNRKPLAVQLFTQFVQRPNETWTRLYVGLLPYCRRLGKEGYPARRYQLLLGKIEALFVPEERANRQALEFDFLIGYSAQMRALYQKAQERNDRTEASPPLFAPPAERDELFGCLLAVADHFEWETMAQRDDDGRVTSSKDGCTNAMLLTAAFAAAPRKTWAKIHEKLIPYLERAGVKTAEKAQRLLRRIEQGLDETDAPLKLGGGFLHGYLPMRRALARGELDLQAWQPKKEFPLRLDSRDAAFGALLALENQVERWALDLEKTDDENRPSNAMRFLARAARRPDEVLSYLRERMRPYAKKLGFPGWIEERAGALWGRIEERGWNTGAPLGPEYLHAFYTAAFSEMGQNDHRKED